MKIFNLFFLIIFFLAKSNLVFAFNFDANNPSSEIVKNIRNAKLTGQDRLTFLGFKIYDISLWSESNYFSYDKKFAISIKYKKNFVKNDLIDRSIIEMRKNHDISDEQEIFFKKNMMRVFNDIKKDDTKTIIFDPKGSIKFYHNSNFNGTINDKGFARKFVDIWLHENSSYPQITKNLLGK
jgi:hypothetical protein